MLGPAEWREIEDALERLAGMRLGGAAGGIGPLPVEDRVQFMVCDDMICDAEEASEEAKGARSPDKM